MNEELALQEEEEPPGTSGSSAMEHRAEEPSDSRQAGEPFIGRSEHRGTRAGHRSGSYATGGRRTLEFRRKFYPLVSTHDWNDWSWQLAHRITSVDELSGIIRLSEAERAAVAGNVAEKSLPLAITPYYASLIDPDNPSQGIRRSMVPTVLETLFGHGEDEDPLGEEHDTVVPGLVHRYPDRVLFLATENCSAYCRYCTRSRIVGQRGEFSIERWERAFAYIESHREIRDVLISGGDPLTLPDQVLEWLLVRLRGIRHVEFLRIGTKVPAVLPMRITPALIRMLRRFHPLWISIHATHPDELTPEMRLACNRLADGGFPLGSQTVLLSGINDDAETMKTLFQGLLTMRVRPYYLYQCDPIPGSAHFRTPVSRGLEIIGALRGYTTGYAVPTYVIDAPGGGGKIPLLPDYVVGNVDGAFVLKNYRGKLYRYPDVMS